LFIRDAAKILRELDWKATTSLEDLCAMRIEADLRCSTKGYCFRKSA
jgi:GDP-D-mannose dehydratase